MNNVSLDLETLGTRPGCMIASIGAVQFDSISGEIGRVYYGAVDISTHPDTFHIDTETVKWWMKQPDTPRSVFGDASKSINEVLDEVSSFFNAVHAEEGHDVNVWGNGSDFDNAILSTAYGMLGMKTPWHYKANRCLRTYRYMYPDVSVEAVGTHHNALDDAIYQAKLCAAINRRIRYGST